MRCWNCGEETMDTDPGLGSGWYSCSNCGATWIKMPELASVLIGETWTDETGRKHYKAHPVRRRS